MKKLALVAVVAAGAGAAIRMRKTRHDRLTEADPWSKATDSVPR